MQDVEEGIRLLLRKCCAISEKALKWFSTLCVPPLLISVGESSLEDLQFCDLIELI
jgi:hypothetical protein